MSCTVSDRGDVKRREGAGYHTLTTYIPYNTSKKDENVFLFFFSFSLVILLIDLMNRGNSFNNINSIFNFNFKILPLQMRKFLGTFSVDGV